jgi:hypothetical protein
MALYKLPAWRMAMSENQSLRNALLKALTLEAHGVVGGLGGD